MQPGKYCSVLLVFVFVVKFHGTMPRALKNSGEVLGPLSSVCCSRNFITWLRPTPACTIPVYTSQMKCWARARVSAAFARTVGLLVRVWRFMYSNSLNLPSLCKPRG